MPSSSFRRQRSKVKWELGGFTLPNKLVQDKSLTDSAFRLLSWMISCSADWDIYQDDIMRRFDWGEKKMRTAIDNLIELKYLINLGQTRKDNGGWGPCDYEFSPHGYTDEEVKEFQINSPYLPEACTGDACTGKEGTKQILIPTTPNLKDVCIADANGSDKSEKKPETVEPQKIRRIDKKNCRGVPVSLGWDELITFSINHKKDWRMTEIEEAWQILQAREGFVNDMIEFIAGTINNLRDKIRAGYANKGKKQCKNQQTSNVKNETKNSPSTSRNDSGSSAEKGTRVSLLEALKRLNNPTLILPPG